MTVQHDGSASTKRERATNWGSGSEISGRQRRPAECEGEAQDRIHPVHLTGAAYGDIAANLQNTMTADSSTMQHVVAEKAGECGYEATRGPHTGRAVRVDPQ